MQKLLLVIAAMLVGFSVLGAVPLCTLPLSIPLSNAQSPQYTELCNLGQLTVRFAAIPNPAQSAPLLTGYFLSLDSVDPAGTKVLHFNPAAGGASSEHLILLGHIRTADGGAWITQATLAQTAGGGVITSEVFCATAPTGTICNDPMGGTLQVAGSGQATMVLSQAVAELWFVKDIFVAENNFVSILQQRYTVPEPVSLLLVGAGLAGLGVCRRGLAGRRG